MSRPTMLDVARLSGVSYQTVSRVINDHPYVSKETRQRVEAAIDALGYRPSKTATKLASKSSKMIAVVLYGIWLPGWSEIALNVELAAKTSGFDVILINITDPRQQLVEALQNVTAWSVDGIIAILPVRGLAFDEVRDLCDAIPLVQIDSERSPEVPSVIIDDVHGTQQLVEHLLTLGHTQLAEIGGPPDWFSAEVRHQACLDALYARGVNPPLYVQANWTASGGYRATKRLLAEGRRFTALVSANDSMALGAICALGEAGLRVPQDVSVVGFDDIPEAAYFSPPLTTARRNLIQLGMAGFEVLMQLMDDAETPVQQRVLSPRVIFRDSTHALEIPWGPAPPGSLPG